MVSFYSTPFKIIIVIFFFFFLVGSPAEVFLTLNQHTRDYFIVSWEPATYDGGCVLDKYVLSLSSSSLGLLNEVSIPVGSVLKYVTSFN